MLGDFDISTDSSESAQTTVAGAMGTLLYMSPEVMDGDPASPASDMFAFGVCLLLLFHPGLTPPMMPQSNHANKMLKKLSDSASVNQKCDKILAALLDLCPEARLTAAEILADRSFSLSGMHEDAKQVKEANAKFAQEQEKVQTLISNLEMEKQQMGKLQEELVVRERDLARLDQQGRDALEQEKAELSQKELAIGEKERAIRSEDARRRKQQRELEEGRQQLEVAREQSEGPCPMHWTNRTSKGRYHLETLLAPESPEFIGCQRLLDATFDSNFVGRGFNGRAMSHQRLVVSRVLRIEDASLWRMYSLQRNEVAASAIPGKHLMSSNAANVPNTMRELGEDWPGKLDP